MNRLCIAMKSIKVAALALQQINTATNHFILLFSSSSCEQPVNIGLLFCYFFFLLLLTQCVCLLVLPLVDYEHDWMIFMLYTYLVVVCEPNIPFQIQWIRNEAKCDVITRYFELLKKFKRIQAFIADIVAY